jgi:hypothetical protein
MKNSIPAPWLETSVRAVLSALLVVGWTACAGKKDPEPLPSQTATQAGPQLEPPPQLPPPIREIRPSRPSTVKVIDPGGGEKEPQSLYEASQRAREQGGPRVEPIAEITDENLSEYAEKAEIIMVEGAPAAPPLSVVVQGSPEADAKPQDVHDEQYWRNGSLELRMGWRRTLDRIEELELESAALRQQFYAEEDPYLRDSHVKPEWDRVLDQLGRLRDRSLRYEQELERFLEEGRRAGAQPGWLSEGWELEPERAELLEDEPEPFSAHQAGEPQVVDEVIDP